MTLIEAAKQGVSQLIRPDVPDGWFEIYIVPPNTGFGPEAGYGPWITVHDASTETGAVQPSKIFIARLPHDDAWQPKK